MFVPLLAGLLVLVQTPTAGNRLAHLDDVAPYHVHRDFPKLITPQWVGEDGVEAVVVLAIDDLTDNAPKYEGSLRPILERLKRIDGRAPVSIMTCKVSAEDPHVKTWLTEGVNLDVHTLTHPCPLLQKGDLAAARRTVNGCIDLLDGIVGNRPVAFRMPCCDSRNTVSPRFFAEVFQKGTDAGHALAIDSSVFNVLTPNDPALPRDIVYDADGKERFRKYLPFPSFVNTIEDYPYPYPIGPTCWEFPCVVPSDWEAQHVQKANNPRTVADLKAVLDAIVIKRGVFNLVFHPHGWIKAEQVVELIDHAVATHGRKVKFLNFREALGRIERHMLGGESLRDARGRDNGVRLLDLNNDGFQDVVIGNAKTKESRVWLPDRQTWQTVSLPREVVRRDGSAIVRFGVLDRDGHASMIATSGPIRLWTFRDMKWVEAPAAGLPADCRPRRFLDIDGDGVGELLVDDEGGVAVFGRVQDGWERLAFRLPDGAATSARFVDLDEDGRLDVVFSDDAAFGVFLFDSKPKGWAREVASGPANAPKALPKIVSQGMERGFWVHSRGLWWQNEDTDKMPDLVDRRSFNDLLKEVEPRGKSQEAALRSLRARPGFVVELMASEPLVRDPIAFDWAADGALFVVEMGDYPLGLDGKGKAGGVVKRLVDTDGDGRYDQASVFLDGLEYPTGVMPWRDGVLISAAPHVLYAEDRDGDGRADHREVLLTGFQPGNPQHRVNGFALGLDGWVYLANGDSGGTIESLKSGRKVAISGRDLRFRPDDGALEAESGQTQYGRQRDDWGNWFGNNNSVWAWHYVIADRHLKRNPRLALTSPRHVVAPDRALYPISRTLPRFNDFGHANHVTSANSVTPYRDELFGPSFAGNLFVSEPVHNLVHRVVLERDGATFQGRRAEDEKDREFLASSDHWFRPTGMKTGPDGALWVADMHRAVIEHPEWIPQDWQRRLDLRAGADQGRIYRVRPVGVAARPIVRLDQLDTPGLVAAMDHPNGPRRDTAMRILMHRADTAAVAPLKDLARKAQRPEVRVQALATLDLLNGADTEDIQTALRDTHPQVRRQSVRMAATRLKADKGLLSDVCRLANDAETSVRMETALALGETDDPEAGRALAIILGRDGEDAWTRTAALSSALPHAETTLLALLRRADGAVVSPRVATPLFAVIAGGKADKGLRELLDVLRTPNGQGAFEDWQLAAANGLCEAAQQAGAPASVPRTLSGLDASGRLTGFAKRVAADEEAPEERREIAIRLLGFEADRLDVRESLAALLVPRVAIRLQRAALTSLGRSKEAKAADVIINAWKAATPTLRESLLETLLSRGPWTAQLLSSLEDECVAPGEIGPVARKRLTDHADERIRERALAVFGGSNEGRKEVLARYEAKAGAPGDATRGADVFRKNCASCHRLRDLGHEVGPDLTTVADRSFAAMLIAVFDPNRAVESRYLGFDVRTTDGRVLSGLIAAETGTSITLRRQEGVEDVLLRADIEEMASSGKSLMPEGLEREVHPDDFADLARFLAELGPPRKEFRGNQPTLVKASEDGRVLLEAAAAEVFGPTIIFEEKYKDLGFWESPGDHAAWTFEVPRAGRYAITIEAACDRGAAGQLFTIEVEGVRLDLTVPSTGTWDDYRRLTLGEMSIGSGRHRLVARPGGPLRGPLLDLKAVELRPR